MVIPGSHKERMYSHHQDGVFVGAVAEEVPSADKAVPIELKAGGISIHHARALHASSAGDAWPLLGVKDWERFNGKELLQGEPSVEPRMVNVPVRIPLPPPERVGSIYEIQTQLGKERQVMASRM